MYPLIRLAKEFFVHRNAPALSVGETHVTKITCMPWDIDVFMEMNNGRVLTLFDFGRFILFRRLGVMDEMKRQKWTGTIAGTAIRYRRRITLFQKLELRSRVIGWDDRFTYVEQAFWRGEECCAHAVLRTAMTAGRGIIPPEELLSALDLPTQSPELPQWVRAWTGAEGQRPWPPMQEPVTLLKVA